MTNFHIYSPWFTFSVLPFPQQSAQWKCCIWFYTEVSYITITIGSTVTGSHRGVDDPDPQVLILQSHFSVCVFLFPRVSAGPPCPSVYVNSVCRKPTAWFCTLPCDCVSLCTLTHKLGNYLFSDKRRALRNPLIELRWAKFGSVVMYSVRKKVVIQKYTDTQCSV